MVLRSGDVCLGGHLCCSRRAAGEPFGAARAVDLTPGQHWPPTVDIVGSTHTAQPTGAPEGIAVHDFEIPQISRRIAMVAHDNKKVELLAWAEFNVGHLRHHQLFATGTTG